MLITVCDDEKSEIVKITKILEDYSATRPDLFVKTKVFENPFDMLDDISTNGAPDIALLDICMPGVLGTEIARELKNKGEGSTDIIFLTTSSDYAVEAYTLRASDYIKKPYSAKTLTDTLDRVAESRALHTYELIKCEKDIVRVDLFAVVYAESKHNLIEIVLKNGSVLKSRMTLTKFSELFSALEGFSLVGASYFVNFNCVVGIHQDTLEMSNGQNLPIPRRLKTELKSQLFDFYKKKAVNSSCIKIEENNG